MYYNCAVGSWWSRNHEINASYPFRKQASNYGAVGKNPYIQNWRVQM